MAKRVKGDESLKRLVAFAEEQGWRVGVAQNNHLKFTREGYKTVFHSSTSSDHRSWLNTRAQLRRAQPLEAHA